MRKFLITLFLCLAPLAANAEGVRCEKIENLRQASEAEGYPLVSIQRPAIKGYAGKHGTVLVEVFGLTREHARRDAKNIAFIEECAGGNIRTLRYSVLAFPVQGDASMHVVDIPLPAGLKRAIVRWCSKAEQEACLSSQINGDDDVVTLSPSESLVPKRSKTK